MAHIPDGILSAPVLIGGAAVALGGVTLGLRSLSDRAIPRAAILSAAFFTASLISVPVGPSSVHLLLSGLMGIMLGIAIFPAVGGCPHFAGFAVRLWRPDDIGRQHRQYRPARLLSLPWPSARSSARPHSSAMRAGLSALIGALSVLGTGGLVALSLALSAPEYTPVASVLLATYLPLALAEAFVTAAVVGFLSRVQPDALSLATGSCDFMMRFLFIALASLALFASPANAHKLKVFATVKGDHIAGYCLFHRRWPCARDQMDSQRCLRRHSGRRHHGHGRDL